jgi:hypothetical protein
MKMNFFIGFAVLGLSLASAKSYEISVDTVSRAGGVQLQPGVYKVTLDGSKVKFTDEDSGKWVETNATVETTAEAKFGTTERYFTVDSKNNIVETAAKAKYDDTAVETNEDNGVTTVTEIDLGGTRTDIKFQ